MKILTATLVLTALTVALAGRANAGGVMYSAPANDSGYVYCDIRNAGTTQIAGKIEGVSYSGPVIWGPVTFTLDGGTATSAAGMGAASCKVTLTKGLVKKVRGVALYHYAEAGTYTIPIQ